MNRPIIRRFARTDVAGQYLLLSITQAGSHSLDLKLVATDQEHLYHGTLRDNTVKSLQASNYNGDLNEWKNILSHTLLQTRPENSSAEQFSGIEAVAAINKSIVTITIRKKVSGITQRLGEIKLEEDDEREEVAAFEWVDAAVATSDDLRSQLETLQGSITQQQREVVKLNTQLDELVQAKKAHEEELLSKFAALLNAKKLKIRDQQHLLSRAQVDPAAAEEIQEARASPPKTRRPGRSGSNKRKANEDIVPASDDEMDDGDYQDHPEDVIHSEEERRVETPDHGDDDDDETEDEDGFEVDAFRQADDSLASNNHADKDDQSSSQPTVRKSIEKPPPRRALPFRRKSGQETSEQNSGGDDDSQNDGRDDDDDDDETDDEL